jgi:hypothetical protein
MGPSSSRSRYQRCGVCRAERGVARVSTKWCSVCRGVGGGEAEKAVAVARGESGRRLREGGVPPY